MQTLTPSVNSLLSSLLLEHVLNQFGSIVYIYAVAQAEDLSSQLFSSQIISYCLLVRTRVSY